MKPFKVICKADDNWEKLPKTTKVITTKRFFGLIKSTQIISDTQKVLGPERDEVCIVIDEYNSVNGKYYNLAGYPYGGYDARFFVRLDEFTETQKEIAEKSEHIFN